MQRDPRAFLWDVRESALAIQAFTQGMDAAGYAANAMVQAAVERKFEVAGEACVRLRDRFPEICAKLDDAPRLVGLRIRVIHGYDDVDDAIVWEVASSKLGLLRKQVASLLG